MWSGAVVPGWGNLSPVEIPSYFLAHIPISSSCSVKKRAARGVPENQGTEVESGLSSLPSHHAAVSMALVRAKGQLLLSACPPPPPGPGKVLLEEPVTAISTPPDMCLSKLPLAGTMPRMTHLWTAWPSRNGLLVLCRVALCFQRGGSSYAPGLGNETGNPILLYICPQTGTGPASSQIHLELRTWTLWYPPSRVHPRPPLIHKHKERHKQRYTSPESQTHPEIYKHTPVTQTHRDSTRTHPPPPSFQGNALPRMSGVGPGRVGLGALLQR